MNATVKDIIKSGPQAATPAKDSYFFCIPTMRLHQCADTLKAYDKNFTYFGHNKPGQKVPIIIFSDALDAKGNAKFGNYEEDLAELRKTAQECKSDVFLVEREDKQRLKELIGSKLKESAEVKAKVPDIAERIERGLLDKIFENSAGGIKNYALLFTLGSRIMMIDDDERPFELAQHSHFQRMENGNSANTRLLGGEERNIGNAYSALHNIDPFEGESSGSYNSTLFTASSEGGMPVKTVPTDVLGGYFSILGLTLKEIEAQLPKRFDRYISGTMHTGKQLSGPISAKGIIYSDADTYTNTTANLAYNNYPHLTALLEPERYPAFTGSDITSNNIAHYSAGVYNRDLYKHKRPLSHSHVVKPYPIQLLPYGELEATQNAKVNFVQSNLTGVLDADTLDILRAIIETPELTDEHQVNGAFIPTREDRMTLPLIASSGNTLVGGIMGIDNRDGQATSLQIPGGRIDDVAYRYDAQNKDCLTVQLPLGQTHIRSEQRQPIANAAYQEEIGTLIKVMLLNGKQENGEYDIDIDAVITDSITQSMRKNGELWYNKIQTAIGETSNAERTAMLERIAAGLKTHFADFDQNQFHKKVITDVKEQLGLYLTMRKIWPDIQQVARESSRELTLTNLKTEQKTDMQKIRNTPGYAKEFSYGYGQDTITNTPERTPRR